MLSWSPVYAAEWSLGKSIELGVVHSDSYNWSEADSDKTTTVGQIKPTLSLTGRGNKADILLLTELDYQRSDFAEEQTVIPRFYGKIASTLVDRTLFLDSDITLDRVIVSSDNTIVDSLNIGNQSSTTVSANLNPRLELELAEVADLDVKYGFNAYTTSSDVLQDSQSNRIDIDLTSKVSNAGYQVGISAIFENTEFAEGDPLRQRSVSIGTSKEWGPDWQLSAEVGREWNEIPDQSSVEAFTPLTVTEQSNTWDLGVRWNPGPRTSLIAGYGGHSFGRQPTIEIVHRSRRSTYSLTWSRGLSRSSVRSFDAATIFDSTEDSSFELPSAFPDTTEFGPGLTVVNTVISIAEEVRAAYLLRGRVSSLGFESIYIQRDSRYQSDKSSSRSVVFRSTLERQINRNTFVTLSYEHARGSSESRIRENIVGLFLRLRIR